MDGDYNCDLILCVKGGEKENPLEGVSVCPMTASFNPYQAKHNITCLWQIRTFSYLKAYMGSLGKRNKSTTDYSNLQNEPRSFII